MQSVSHGSPIGMNALKEVITCIWVSGTSLVLLPDKPSVSDRSRNFTSARMETALSGQAGSLSPAISMEPPILSTRDPNTLWVKGPLSLQSEAMVNFVDQDGVTATLPGVYAQVGYFLTGEHRPYDRKTGQIDRIIPFRNFSFNKDGCNTGPGAWEIAGRFSYIDLNDKSIQGGTMANFTAGVNWYINPYVKFVVNYIHSSTDYAGRGNAGLPPIPPLPGADSRHNQTDMVGARCQMDF